MPTLTALRLYLLAIVLGVSLGVVAAQEPPEQYPGQKNHAAPPEDYYCSGDPKTPADHKCACANMPKSKDDLSCKEIEPVDDPQCSVYCHKNKCACKESCPDT